MISYYLDGLKISPTKAQSTWLAFDQERGSDPEESGAIFDRATIRDQDGEIAREYLLDAGIEVLFYGTNSSYDKE